MCERFGWNASGTQFTDLNLIVLYVYIWYIKMYIAILARVSVYNHASGSVRHRNRKHTLGNIGFA